MNKTEINSSLHQTYQKVYQMDIEDDENLFLKSGDSVLHMAFATFVRDSFKIELTMAEYESNTSLKKLTELIWDKLLSKNEEVE